MEMLNTDCTFAIYTHERTRSLIIIIIIIIYMQLMINMQNLENRKHVNVTFMIGASA